VAAHVTLRNHLIESFYFFLIFNDVLTVVFELKRIDVVAYLKKRLNFTTSL